METSLNYNFQRKSENHVDWLLNIIKSEKYYEIEGIILNNQQEIRFE
ncbi:MAG TPA: hypothetical protein VIS27_01435 [Yeosuana sp.]